MSCNGSSLPFVRCFFAVHFLFVSIRFCCPPCSKRGSLMTTCNDIRNRHTATICENPWKCNLESGIKFEVARKAANYASDSFVPYVIFNVAFIIPSRKKNKIPKNWQSSDSRNYASKIITWKNIFFCDFVSIILLYFEAASNWGNNKSICCNKLSLSLKRLSFFLWFSCAFFLFWMHDKVSMPIRSMI